MEISDIQNSTLWKKSPLEARELQWQCHLNISISALLLYEVEHG